MRDIRFRAWNAKGNNWILGYDKLGGFSLFGECMIMGEWAYVLETFLFSQIGYTPDDLKVMQFTGITDKNGEDIYEGDICSLELDTNLGVVEQTGEMVWIDSEARFVIRTGIADILETSKLANPPVIIGNIWETPELLNK